MRLLLLSCPKSGTLWLYQILASVLDANQIERQSFIGGHPAYAAGASWPHHFAGRADIDYLFMTPRGDWACYAEQRVPIPSIDAYLSRTNFVRSHSGLNASVLRLLPRFDRTVYLVRDPRDRIISWAHYLFLPERLQVAPRATRGHRSVEDYLAAEFAYEMHRWVREVSAYLQILPTHPMHVVFYERLLHAFDSELDALVDFLGLSLSPEARARLASEVAFATMQRQHRGHVRQGEAGGWRTRLTAAQQAQAVRIAGPLLSLLGYATDDPQPDGPDHLPRLPDPVDPGQLARIARGVPEEFRLKVKRFLRRDG